MIGSARQGGPLLALVFGALVALGCASSTSPPSPARPPKQTSPIQETPTPASSSSSAESSPSESASQSEASSSASEQSQDREGSPAQSATGGGEQGGAESASAGGEQADSADAGEAGESGTVTGRPTATLGQQDATEQGTGQAGASERDQGAPGAAGDTAGSEGSAALGGRTAMSGVASPTPEQAPGTVGADGVPAGSQEPGGGGGGEDGVPIEDVPPELLISFGRGSPDAGAAAGAATDEELRKALELLAEHASQVDQMIQDEESQALSAGGDRGVGPEGGGFAGAGEPAKAGIAGGIGADSAVTPYSESDPSAAPGASGSGGGYRPPPQDIGDGSDDDTFAAQLREIAMNEADPELRERYWDEYRKYKGLK